MAEAVVKQGAAQGAAQVGALVAPDVLGGQWTARTIALQPDGLSPDPVATLVQRPAKHQLAILYVHGFVDYFFHPHVADALDAAGYDLVGLDLRDYGRSIRPGRPENHTRELATYAEELDAAIALLREDHDEVVLLGHSTGGLVTALYTASRPGKVDALILNSPWLDLRGPWFERTVLTWLMGPLAKAKPDLVVNHMAEGYGRALHSDTGGEWTYDLAWKPYGGFPVRSSFVAAVRRGHARVARGLGIDVPILVLTSDRTGSGDAPPDLLLTTDAVLDVEQMAARAPRLGADVTLVTVPGGAHDLALSPSPARERYLDEIADFLSTRLG